MSLLPEAQVPQLQDERVCARLVQQNQHFRIEPLQRPPHQLDILSKLTFLKVNVPFKGKLDDRNVEPRDGEEPVIIGPRLWEEGLNEIYARDRIIFTIKQFKYDHRDDDLGLALSHVQLGNTP